MSTNRPLYLVAVIKPNLDRLDEARARFGALMTASLAEDGCELYDLVADDADPTTWLMLEKWSSREQWDAHMLTQHCIDFNAGSADILRADTELRFYDPA